MKKTNPHLSKLIEQYENSNLLKDLEAGLTRDHSENVPLYKMEMNPLCTKYFLRKSQVSPLEITMNEKGVLDPILVRPQDDKYQVLSGFKRYYLAKKNKFESMPAIVKYVPDDLMLLIICQRLRTYSDENILNKAYIYDAILKQYPLSREDLSHLMGTSISQISNTLRLLKLDDCVKRALKDERISYGQARMLVGLDKEDQEVFLNKILTESLSVREVENYRSFKTGKVNKEGNLKEYALKHNVRIIREKNKLTFKFNTKKEIDSFIKQLIDSDEKE